MRHFKRERTKTFVESGDLITDQNGYRTAEEQIQPMLKAGFNLDEYRSKINSKNVFIADGFKDGYYISKLDIAEHMRKVDDLDKNFKDKLKRRKEEEKKELQEFREAKKNIVVNNVEVVDHAGNQ